MNNKIILTAAAIIVSAVFSAGQSALAQENNSRGARFNFAPNVWKAETPRIPRGYNEPVHAVRSGAVPKAESLLGLDPTALQPAPVRVAPVAPQMNTRAVPSIPRVASNVAPTPAFNPMFGTPTSIQQRPVTPPVAHTPTQPVQPVVPAQPQQPMLAAKAPVHVGRPASSGRRHHVTTGVTGRLASKPRVTGSNAAPAQALSYDKGYVPGGSIAASSSVSGRGVGEVSGRILNHKKH